MEEIVPRGRANGLVGGSASGRVRLDAVSTKNSSRRVQRGILREARPAPVDDPRACGKGLEGGAGGSAEAQAGGEWMRARAA